MISIFKGYGLFLSILLVALACALRLPQIFGPLPVLKPELEWILVGERMANGHMLYKDIYTNLSPLTAIIYWLIDLANGRSEQLNGILAIGITILCVLYFNISLNNRNAFLDRSFVPSLILLLFMHLSYDMLKLSPPLLSLLFLMLAFNRVALEMARGLGISDEIFETGLFIGLATLFHLPNMVFIFWAILSMILFTGASWRQYFLVVFGFAFPIFVVFMFFYINNAYTEVMYNWLSSFVRVRLYSIKDFFSVIALLIVPVILAFVGFYRISQSTRYNSYQTRMQQIMILWLVVGAVSMLFIPFISPMQLITLLPPLAFFASHFFTTFRKTIVVELSFLVSAVIIISMYYYGLNKTNNSYLSLTDLQVNKNIDEQLKGQKILVIGDNIDEYYHTIPATCYLNWRLSQIDLKNPNDYVSVINIFDNFKNDPPDFVIDKEKVFNQIFLRIPELSKKYIKLKDGLYVRK